MKNVLLQKVNRLVPILLLLIFCLFFLTSCSQQKETFIWKNFESTSLGVSFQYPENVFSVIEISGQKILLLAELQFEKNFSAVTPDSKTVNVARTQLTNRSFEKFAELLKESSGSGSMKLDIEKTVTVSNYSAIHRVWSSKWSSIDEQDNTRIFTDQYLVNINDKDVLIIMSRSVVNGKYKPTYFATLVKSLKLSEIG